MSRLHIRNARLVNPAIETVTQGSLLIEDGRITASGAIDPPADVPVVDAKGQLLAPGIIDIGVFATDRRAFHFGGITRAALMPDGPPPLDNPGLIERAAKAGKPDLWIHPLAAATRNLEGHELAEVGLMQRSGARAIATGRIRIADAGVMLRLLTYAGGLDLVTIVHSEDEGLTRKAVATEGEMAMRLGLPAAPALAEAMAIARDLALVEQSGGRPPLPAGDHRERL